MIDFKQITIKILFLFLFFGFSQKMWPQSVENEQFGQMLIGLLTHSVEEITVIEILENKRQNKRKTMRLPGMPHRA